MLEGDQDEREQRTDRGAREQGRKRSPERERERDGEADERKARPERSSGLGDSGRTGCGSRHEVLLSVPGARRGGLVPVLETLESIAKKIGADLPQLAIAWCLKNPNVSSVILGASKLEQLENNLAALQFLDSLDEELMDEINVALSALKEIDI